MRITKRQLRQIIREAIDVVNVETGEVIDFGDDSISGLPDDAVPDLVKRLGLNMSPSARETVARRQVKVECSPSHRLRMELRYPYRYVLS